MSNNPNRIYKEVWIGLGGMQSAVYATEVSTEEYLTFTTEETEKMEVLQLADKLGGDIEQAINLPKSSFWGINGLLSVKNSYVLILSYLEGFDGESMRIIVGANGVQQFTSCYQASFCNIAFSDNHLPCICRHLIGIYI